LIAILTYKHCDIDKNNYKTTTKRGFYALGGISVSNLTKTPAPIAYLGISARDQEKVDAFLRGRFRSSHLILQTWIDIL
jgi:hypothetical protein